MQKSVFATLLLAASSSLPAANFSFTGAFGQDDNVQAFVFSVGAPSTITLRSWSYAGGVNASGATIAGGGFDPILSLFSGVGAGAVLVNHNDDGGCGLVAQDLGTGRCWDTFFSSMVAAGTYTATIQQFNNFANGPTLGDGFAHSGGGNFTSADCTQGFFCDVSGVNPFNNRDAHWAFDILNVNFATTTSTPEPATLLLFGSSTVLLAVYRRTRNRQKKS